MLEPCAKMDLNRLPTPDGIATPYWISPRSGALTFEARKATTRNFNFFSLSHIHTSALPPNTNTNENLCSYGWQWRRRKFLLGQLVI